MHVGPYLTSNVLDIEFRIRFQTCRSSDLSHVCNTLFLSLHEHDHCAFEEIDSIYSVWDEWTFLFSITEWFPVFLEAKETIFNLLSSSDQKRSSLGFDFVPARIFRNDPHFIRTFVSSAPDDLHLILVFHPGTAQSYNGCSHTGLELFNDFFYWLWKKIRFQKFVPCSFMLRGPQKKRSLRSNRNICNCA